jgi:uncharacterized protein
MQTQATTKGRVMLYCGATIAAFWLLMFSFRLGFHPPEWVALTAIMWMPGLLSTLWRVGFKEGFGDVGWRVGKGRYWAWAYILPLVFGVLSYGLALLLQKVTVDPRLAEQPMLDALYFKLRWFGDGDSEIGMFSQRFVAVAIIGMVPGFFLALGEELGWRGYLLQRLLRTGWRYPVLLGALIWAVWHLPLLLLTGYGHGALSVMLHTVLILLFGVFIGWLRLASGSVWVAAMAHASFNGFVQSLFGVSFVGEKSWIWVGDYGVLILIPYGFLIAWLYRTRRVQAAISGSVLTQ